MLQSELRLNEERMTGKTTNLGGRAAEAYGRASGDMKHELQGRARQAEGAAQELYGLLPDQCRPIIEENTRELDAIAGDARGFLRAIDEGTYKPE